MLLRRQVFVPRAIRSLHNVAGTPIPYSWLRDSCQCPHCVHPSTSQKLHRTSDVLHPYRSTVKSESRNEEGLRITWGDDHSSFYPVRFLERYARSEILSNFHRRIIAKPWNRMSITETSSLFINYTSLSSSTGLVTAIEQLSQYGLLFVSGVPNLKTSNEECELRILAERFGEIRPTFYGLLWNVINKRNSKNIAYTNLSLDLHMDLLYFQHPPRYQILHCLRNKVLGGTSVFVDGFHAAETLRTQSPSSFATLASTPVPFQYINDGHHLYHTHPTIALDPVQSLHSAPAEARTIAHINYSPPFQAPFPLDRSPDEFDKFYRSLRQFADLLDGSEGRYEYTMREGDAVIFDNRRVLHARTAFEDILGQEVKEGEASRWLKGCYLEADAILDRYRVIKARLAREASSGSLNHELEWGI
ncbi:hypothetical protein AMATHDRAFT_143270 [Amanita thiersii Skay4041]|uniref:TauD/TfdA-like domain-containing protein n=1 Tax=Amanita thiersii Skay4041 TaxID=703135 RepID=A0A2A9NKT5_9AGAR|nr:hypothetical protein AMATHDRAFT_143270 [Amanita thiersii Skay4041]